jgi:hypothetical protein
MMIEDDDRMLKVCWYDGMVSGSGSVTFNS